MEFVLLLLHECLVRFVAHSMEFGGKMLRIDRRVEWPKYNYLMSIGIAMMDDRVIELRVVACSHDCLEAFIVNAVTLV